MTIIALQQPIPIRQTVTKQEAIDALNQLSRFISPAQFLAFALAMRGEERQFFYDKAVELANIIKAMPETYQTDGQGLDAVAYLHYFIGEYDWFIVEKDMLHDQLQAFGLAKMWEQELGYININELRENQVELDLHWTPKPLKEVAERPA